MRFNGLDWEGLQSVQLTPGAGGARRLQFDRTLADGVTQHYSGIVSGPSGPGIVGNQIVAGTFQQDGSTYSWSASGVIHDAGISELTMVGNGFPGQLKIRLGGGVAGRFSFADDPWHDPGAWSALTNLRVAGTSVSFDVGSLSFRGTQSGESLTGSWTQAHIALSLNWSAVPVDDWGGTSGTDCYSDPDSTIGAICATVQLRGALNRQAVDQELAAHPIEHALRDGAAPFGPAEMARYVGGGVFRIGPPPPTLPARPGFVTDYAANHDHDLVETLDYYVANPAALWNLAMSDIRDLGNSLLWRKREFIRTDLMRDAEINGRWSLTANGYSGTMSLGVHSAPAAVTAGGLSTVNLLGRDESIDGVQFNGETLQFHRREPGGVDQQFIGVLRGNSITGLFTHNGVVYDWSAISVH